MRASKGGLTHEQIMKLTWRQYETYQESFKYLMRAESEKGQDENKIDDLEALKQVDEVKEEKATELESIKAKLQKHKERAERGMRGKMKKLVK